MAPVTVTRTGKSGGGWIRIRPEDGEEIQALLFMLGAENRPMTYPFYSGYGPAHLKTTYTVRMCMEWMTVLTYSTRSRWQLNPRAFKHCTGRELIIKQPGDKP